MASRAAPSVEETAARALGAVLELEAVEVGPVPGREGVVDVFRGSTPLAGRLLRRVYGGQLLGQALKAASATVEPALVVHSLHAYFLRPGDALVPFVYAVHRVRDGRSFSVRRVEARQNGLPIFHMHASFQVAEPGLQHEQEMPLDAPDPATLPTQQEVWAAFGGKLGDERGLPERARAYYSERSKLPFPVDLRLVGALDAVANADEPRPPRQLVWMRAPGALPDDPNLHRCAVAYGSDLYLLATSLLPHNASFGDRIQGASLDHSMWFHKPFRADEWLLCEMWSPAASGGRGLAFGHIYNQQGELVVSVAQEGLIRDRTLSEPQQPPPPQPPRARL